MLVVKLPRDPTTCLRLDIHPIVRGVVGDFQNLTSA
jgi:hypothetical protein